MPISFGRTSLASQLAKATDPARQHNTADNVVTTDGELMPLSLEHAIMTSREILIRRRIKLLLEEQP